MGVCTRAVTRDKNLADDPWVNLPDYSYRRHENGETAASTAYAAAKRKGIKDPVAHLLYTYPNLSPEEFSGLKDDMERKYRKAG